MGLCAWTPLRRTWPQDRQGWSEMMIMLGAPRTRSTCEASGWHKGLPWGLASSLECVRWHHVGETCIRFHTAWCGWGASLFAPADSKHFFLNGREKPLESVSRSCGICESPVARKRPPRPCRNCRLSPCPRSWLLEKNTHFNQMTILINQACGTNRQFALDAELVRWQGAR